MSAAKAAGGFFVRSLLVFVALFATWPVVGATYASVFRGAGNGIVGFGSGGSVRFIEPADKTAPHDVELTLRDREEQAKRSVAVSSRRHGFMPSAFLFALIVATPVSWSRRARATAWAFVAMHAYIAVKLALMPIAYPINAASGYWPDVLAGFFWVVSGSSAGWMMVPLVIWALATLRKSDLPILLTPADSTPVID